MRKPYFLGFHNSNAILDIVLSNGHCFFIKKNMKEKCKTIKNDERERKMNGKEDQHYQRKCLMKTSSCFSHSCVWSSVWDKKKSSSIKKTNANLEVQIERLNSMNFNQ